MNDTRTRNLVLLRKLSVVAVMMFGFAFALVPLYEKICEVTGINQLVKKDELTSTQIDTSRLVTIEFDANSRGEVGWQLAPLERKRKVHPGELVHVVYELKNPTGTSVAGQAIPSYGPQYAGQYVKKLDCFCFSKQEIRAGETRRLPVVFVIDPALPREVHTVTLSYTMFEIGGTQRQASEAQPPESRDG
ncbi:MAG: cytochrome c oxidase assembly protein [Gammaproteobacteria bacterium]